jgi:hypothetical protein
VPETTTQWNSPLDADIEDVVEVAETVECENCTNEVGVDDTFYNEYLGLTVCESCHDRYTYHCGSCGSEHGSDEAAYECCRYECDSCGQWWDDEDERDNCCGTASAEPPYLSEIPVYQITVPVIENRPARRCSLEQELASGADVVAGLLYREGISNDNHIRHYHSSGSGEAGTVHIEEDGSLPSDGGEVVYDRFDLSYEPHSTRLSRVVGKIRQLRDDHKLVKTSFAAGIHVHVSVVAQDGSSLSTRDVAALYEVWCYAEDMLYSVSAAGWNRHRQPTDSDRGGGYCKAVPKITGSATPAKVWRAMRADRYFGLNFQRLYNAVARCSCGASTVGDWESCDCGAMDAATIEWRVFNASTLPRTIHAWIVLAQALTAYSKLHELGTLPKNEYGSQTASEKREVLNHLLDILPLTDEEKLLIEDAADRSPGL